MKQFEADKANEEAVEPTKDSLGEWMRYWLENISKPTVRATTYHGYKNLVERHLIPALFEIGAEHLLSVDMLTCLQRLLDDIVVRRWRCQVDDQLDLLGGQHLLNRRQDIL